MFGSVRLGVTIPYASSVPTRILSVSLGSKVQPIGHRGNVSRLDSREKTTATLLEREKSSFIVYLGCYDSGVQRMKELRSCQVALTVNQVAAF
jgi:hypothetical protein